MPLYAWLPHIFAFVFLLCLPSSLQNSFVAKNISQKTACAGAQNALFVTLATSNSIHPPSNEQGSSTGVDMYGIEQVSVPGSSIRISDQAKSFSGFAILYSDVVASSTIMAVDNAVAVGIQVGDLLALEDEVVMVELLLGSGCAPSSLVLSSCMQEMHVLRAQAGTAASPHNKGSLMYRVIANYIVDGSAYGSVNKQTFTTQTIFNLENISSFLSFFPNSSSTQYALVDDEIVEVTSIFYAKGFAMKLSQYDLNLSFAITPSFDIAEYMYMYFPNASVYLEIRSYQKQGNIASVASTAFFDDHPQAFVISAIQVTRGTKASLVSAHNPGTTIFLLRDTWMVFSNHSLFQAVGGQLQVYTIAVTESSKIVSFSFPVQNSFSAQQPASIQIYVAGDSGVNTNYPVAMDFAPVSHSLPFTMPLLICKAGTWIQDGNRSCSACQVGKFSQACGGTSCTACVAGTYTSLEGQTACLECVAGYYCLGDSDQAPCRPGFYSDPGATNCTLCPPGSSCVGASPSQPCASGTFSNVSGVTACQLCQAGKFAPKTGSTTCSPCQNGTFSSQDGASLCQPCAPGTFAASSKQTSCDQCARGRYQSSYQSSSCLECPANSGARIEMGICYGSCGGSKSVLDCLCLPGYTRFDHFGLDCVPIAFTRAVIGQSSSCKDSLNMIGVTMSVNAEYNTAVQNIEIRSAGEHYLPARLSLQNRSGSAFLASAVTDENGAFNGIKILQAGSGFLYGQIPLDIFYSAGCAVDDSGCETYLQTSSVSTIRVVQNGTGYTDGVMRILGSRGGGFLASFKTDPSGGVASWSIAKVSDRGQGYRSAQPVTLYYPTPTSCGPNANGELQICAQENTITWMSVRGGTLGCDRSTVILATGGGGEGFQAKVTAVDFLTNAIVLLQVVNHGVNYVSDPLFYSSNPNCICNSASSNKSIFNDCLKFTRATGAVVLAYPALNAELVAHTGTRLVLSSSAISQLHQEQGSVSISALSFQTVSCGVTETCGILSNSSTICWGQSLKRQFTEYVETWTCDYSARYWRYVTLSTRNGGRTVSMAEIQFFRSNLQLPVAAATNPAGVNPLGFFAASVIDGDSQTMWIDRSKQPLQFDFGEPVIVDSYRWMTSPSQQETDPTEWRLEASNDPTDAGSWVLIHQVSSRRQGPYSIPQQTTSQGVVFFPRSSWTRFWNGSCVVPSGISWRTLSLSSHHSCGVDSKNVGNCWGSNTFMQLNFPGQSCNCPTFYGALCNCKSTNFSSEVIQKLHISSTATSCQNNLCYNTYAQGSCISNGCRFIYDSQECLKAAESLGLTSSNSLIISVDAPSSPKGCDWLFSNQVLNRLRFNTNNQSSLCSSSVNCVCKDCSPYTFRTIATDQYCSGIFQNHSALIQGASTVSECQEVCKHDESCDYLVFYPEGSSIACAPCCFRSKGSCQLVDPFFYSPPATHLKVGAKWSTISAGEQHTCGISDLGRAHCWGYNGEGQCDLPPFLAARSWISISAATYHTCGILDDTSLYCWGAQNKSAVNVGQVIPIPGQGTYQWRAVSTAIWHTCAVSLEGKVFCWGCGGRDRLGRTIGVTSIGDNVDKGQCNVPLEVQEWQAVSVGEYHSCGVTGAGQILCWGCQCNPSYCPAWNSPDVNYGQCDVPQGYSWTQVSAGKFHTCGTTWDGKTLCWGCVTNSTKAFLDESGKLQRTNGSWTRMNDYGQCDQPNLNLDWLLNNPLQSHATITNSNLYLNIQANIHGGSSNAFSFIIRNPKQEQNSSAVFLSSQGVSIAPVSMQEQSASSAPFRVINCEPGSFWFSGVCQTCTAGKFSVNCGERDCALCNPGTYSVSSQSACRDCPLGTFSSSYGSTSCSSCPQGSVGPVTGALSQADGCRECGDGSYSFFVHVYDDYLKRWQSRTTACLTCPPGFFCPGGSVAQACPQGTYQAAQGAAGPSQCLACPMPAWCSGRWLRFQCLSGPGFANGTVFPDEVSCQAACTKVDRSKGECRLLPGTHNGCLEGYRGALCQECASGFFPDLLNFKCSACPGRWNDMLLLVSFVGASLVVVLLALSLFDDDVLVTCFKAFLTFLQVQDLSMAIRFLWPAQYNDVLHVLHVLSFRTMFMSPTCFIHDIDKFWQYSHAVLLFFPAALLVCSGLIAAGVGSGRAKKGLFNLTAWLLHWSALPWLMSIAQPFDCTCLANRDELLYDRWNNCSSPGARRVLGSYPYLECDSAPHALQSLLSELVLLLAFVALPVALVCLPLGLKRDVDASGVLQVFNLGNSKDEDLGLKRSQGVGQISQLELEIQNLTEVHEIAKVELENFVEIEEQERTKGRKKEVQRALHYQEQLEEAIACCEERVMLLKQRLIEMRRSLERSELQVKCFSAQQQSCSRAKQCQASSLVNFVETKKYQKKRLSRMARTLGWARRRHVGFLRQFEAYRRFHRQVHAFEKFVAKLDIFRKWILIGFAGLGLTVLVPSTLALALVAHVADVYRRYRSRQGRRSMRFLWSSYGTRQEIREQVYRVDPLFAQHFLFNKETIAGKIAMVFRGRGEQHESTLLKVKRIQEAGAVAVIIVNEKNRAFSPVVNTENFAIFQDISIPVVGIASSDMQYLTDGVLVQLQFRYALPKLIGLERVTYLFSLDCLLPLISHCQRTRGWFELVVLARKMLMVLVLLFFQLAPSIHAILYLVVNFVFFTLMMMRPYENNLVNWVEVLSSTSCLISSILALLVVVVFQDPKQVQPFAAAVPPRQDLLEGLAAAILFNFLAFSAAMASFLVVRLMRDVYLLLKRCLAGGKVADHYLTSTKKPPVRHISHNFVSALHAQRELFRVLPSSSLCRSSLEAVRCALQEQDEERGRKEKPIHRNMSNFPWFFQHSKGQAGVQLSKDLLAFIHFSARCTIEVPANSAGEFRFRASQDVGICSCSADGTIWKKDGFFSPTGVNEVERTTTRFYLFRSLPSWQAQDELASLWSHSSTRAPSTFGRWLIEERYPFTLIRHSEKSSQIWLTQKAAVCLLPGARAMWMDERGFSILDLAESNSEQLVRSALDSPFSCAIQAIGASKHARRRGSSSQAWLLEAPKPASALAAIKMALLASACSQEAPELSIHTPPKSVSSVREEASISHASGQSTVTNSNVIDWKRPGKRISR